MSKIVLIGKRLIVKPIEQESVTKGGIIIAETAKERPMHGKVMAWSEECECFKEGDEVYYGKYCGADFKPGEEDLLILDLADVLAITRD